MTAVKIGFVIKEPLIKSRQKTVCTSCLHIFRHFAQKFSDRRQYAEELFEQTDEKSDGAICTNDLISASLRKFSISSFEEPLNKSR